MIRYTLQRSPDTELRDRLRDPANERRKFGYQWLFILLRREDEASGINRNYPFYREVSLGVRKRKGRKRAVGVRAPLLVEANPNAHWRWTSGMTRWSMAGCSGSSTLSMTLPRSA